MKTSTPPLAILLFLVVSHAAIACGPPLFEGSAVYVVIDQEEFNLESKRELYVDDDAYSPYDRVKLDIDNLSLGWPSTEIGTYGGLDLVQFEYKIEHDFEHVTYHTRHCESPVSLVEITRHDYGLISGSFAGKVCQFQFGNVAGVPVSLDIGGTFSATIADGLFN